MADDYSSPEWLLFLTFAGMFGVWLMGVALIATLGLYPVLFGLGLGTVVFVAMLEQIERRARKRGD